MKSHANKPSKLAFGIIFNCIIYLITSIPVLIISSQLSHIKMWDLSYKPLSKHEWCRKYEAFVNDHKECSLKYISFKNV